jgi:outer membrane receptor protein involved in Fe transport
VSYVGERVGVFMATPERQLYPSYTKGDLSAGVKYDTWTVGLFVNNVTDQRGILLGGLGAGVSPVAFFEIQPRTVGVNIGKTF